MYKPTIPEVLPIVKEYYAQPGNGAGGNLHIVLDDGNINDSSVEYCMNICKENNDKKGIELCNKLMRMSKTQRRKIYIMQHA